MTSKAETVSALLFGLWTDGKRIDQLPADLRPADEAEGYAIQALLEARSDGPLFGWKIAATSLAGQAHIRVAGPLAGRILPERVLKKGEDCVLGSNLMRVAELEFAFRMASSVEPRAQPYSVGEILERVGTLHPAIEVPDTRLTQFELAGAPQLVADNACANLFLPGEATTADWRAIDLSRHPVSGVVNGTAVHEGNGANVLGDPRVALAWLANQLSSLGIPLRVGQVVTTGTCVVPIAVAPGDHVRGDFGPLGEIELRFA
ncbi:fumarylacetoacetate hydrolase family protein [Sphingopyxis sp. J-6]|uniref:2-keto-4-pentenoate hydratase n=1 Tax=Sphingopyxis sp. J-6 TaxID=3122054 RepID=UPI0039844B51